MPNGPLAQAMQPSLDASTEADYRALCTALSESGRGRAFLAEFARRSRDADSATLKAAIERLEAHLRGEASAVQRLRDELRMLLIAIRIMRPQIGGAATAPVKAAKLAELLDLMERRIEAMCGTSAGEAALPEKTADAGAEPVQAADAPRIPPAANASSERAELPLRSRAQRELPMVASKAGEPANVDPLAALMTLSEDERLALFS